MSLTDLIGDAIGEIGSALKKASDSRKFIRGEWLEEGFAYAIYAQPNPNFPFVVVFYHHVDGKWQTAGPRNAQLYDNEFHLSLSGGETPSEYIRSSADDYYRQYPDKPKSDYPIGRTKTPPNFPRYFL